MSNNSNQYSKQLESLFSDAFVPPPDPVRPRTPDAGSPANGGALKYIAPMIERLPVEALPVIPSNGKTEHAPGPDFERLFEMSAEMSCVVEADGWFRQVNPACEAGLGWNSTELSRRLFFELAHPDDVTATAAEFQKLAKGAKKIQFECRCRRKTGDYRRLSWQVQSGSDKALYAIAREPAESRPTAAGTNWDSLFAGITDVILIKDVDGRYVEIAPTNPSKLIRPPQDLLGKTVDEVMPPDIAATFKGYIRRALDGETVQAEYELTIGGENLWFDATIAKFTENTVFWVARDITKRKQTEETLAQRATELEVTTRFLDSVVENLPTMLFVKDAEELRFIRWNKAGEELIGFKRDDLLGRNDYDFFPKEEADFFTTKDHEVLNGGQLVDIPEEPIQTAYGTTRTLHTRKIPIRGADGKPRYLLGISEDITARKQAEEALRESESRLLEAQALAKIGSYTLDLDTGVVTWSQQAYALFGYNPAHQQLSFETFTLGVYPEDRDSLSEALQRVSLQGGEFEHEVRLIRQDGALIAALARGRAITTEAGRVVRVLGTLEDITERKQSAKALQESEQRFRALANANPLPVLISRIKDGLILYANDSIESLLGYPANDLVGNRTPNLYFNPADRQTVLEAVRRDGFVRNHEVAGRKQDGSQVWVSLSIQPLTYEGEACFLSSFFEITNRRQAEEELRRSRERYEVAVQGANDGIWDWNILTNEVYYSPRWKSMLGYEDHEVENAFSTFTALVHPDDIPGLQGLIEDYLARRVPVYESEIRMRHKDGTYRWILMRGRALWDADGKPYRMAGSHTDITELKQAAETLAQRATELEETTRFMDSVIENLPTMLFVKDAEELRFVRWNKAGEDLIGFKHHDLVGKNDYDFFPKEEADFFTVKDRDVLAGGVLVDIPEEPIQTAGGATRFLHTRKVPIFGADGKPKYLLGISEDITERRQTEQIIREDEERFRVIASATPIPVLISRARDGVILYANNRLEGLLGYISEDLIGNVTPNLYYDLGDRQAVLDTIRQRGFVKDLEVQGSRKDGTPVWVSLSVYPITFSGESALLTSFFDLTARKQSEAELQRRNEELSALNRLIATATSSLDLYQLLKNTAKEMVQLLRLRNTGIALLNADRQSLTVIADHNASPEFPSAEGVVLPIAGNASAQYVIENKCSLVIAEAQTDPMTDAIHDLMRVRGTTSLIIVPLLAREEVIGTIGADITDPARRFTPEEVFLLETMSRQLAGAVDNIRLFESTQRRANEMATVAQVSAAVSATRDLSTLLQRVVDLARSNFNLYHAHVYLLDDVGQTLVLAAGAGEVGRTMVSQGWRIPLNREQSLVARAARTRQGVVVNDVTQEPGFLPNALLPDTRSELAVPMIVGDKVIGVLDVQADIPNRFSDEDVNIQTALANQVAIAVDNARSFERSEQSLRELGKLTRQLTREGWSEYFEASTAASIGYAYDLAQIVPLKPASQQDGDNPGGGAADTSENTAIVQSLTVRGETIGQLALEDVEQSDEEVQAVIAAIAERLSGHIENLRLTEQEQRRAAQLARLSQIQSALSLATTEAEILSVVTLAVRQPDWLTMHYIETGEGDHPLTLHTVALWKDGAIQHDDSIVGQRFPVTLFATTRLWLQQPDQVLYIADVQNDPRTNEDLRASARRAGHAAMCTLPLRSGGRWQGTINLSWPNAAPLTPDEEFVLEQMMEPLASTVASRRSYLAEQTARRENERRAAELETVAKLSTAASTILDSQDLLQAVVDLTKERFNLYHAHIYLLDETAQTLVLTAGAGEIGQRMVNEGRSIPMDVAHSIVATTARTRQPTVINDVRESPTFLPNAYLPNTRAEMAVPLVVGDRLLGVFDVQSDEAGRFSSEEARIQVALASQVAVALQNATLFAEQTATVTRLRELDQLKSAFLANMSHELRTPLNSILGFTEVLMEGIDGPLNDRMENDLSVVYKNGQHLLNLINDILDMAKIEAGKMRLSAEWFNVQEVLEEVIETAAPLANTRSLDLRLLTPLDTVMEVEADRVRVRQVMLNLVNNALKFTERGSVMVDAVKGEATLRIIVKDTGVGIPTNQLESIFSEFHQVDSSTTRKAGGTGLGLPISRRLIELHSGRLWAESNGVAGEGSTFTVELPIESRYNRTE